MKRVVIAMSLLLCACREGPDMFSVPNAFEGQSNGRLTFNPAGDHAPTWADNDRITYEAPGFAGVPPGEGVLLQVPRTGGVTAAILPTVQSGGVQQPWLSGAAYSPDAKSIAFFELNVRNKMFDRVSCPFSAMGPLIDTVATNSFLTSARLRVRKLDSTASDDAGTITINFSGLTFNSNNELVANTAFPFHRVFENEGVPFFRASWSPDGTRLVFSDGLNLRLWTIGQASSTVIPNTDDGILPAWSPDGTQIAYSRLVRIITQKATCFGLNDGAALPAATISRTIYTNRNTEDYTLSARDTAQLMVIKPDGTGARSLGAGDAPLWQDNQTIIAHRTGGLFRINATTGAGTAITNTQDGFEPALSKDGRNLVYAKRTAVGQFHSTYDLWTTTAQ